MRGARQHNLKGFDLEIPRRAFTVITGPSGSGKSSLAFDTIYAEGQRRYVESLSAYARQFLERMEKPDVDSIDGLSPAVAIEQKNPTKTSRSTVGTATEIYDYLRLLWARVGHTFCPLCGREMRPDTVQSVVDTVLSLRPGLRFHVAFPLVLSPEVTHEVVVENLREQGFVRLSVDGAIKHLDDLLSEPVDVTLAKELLVVVDRLVVGRRRARTAGRRGRHGVSRGRRRLCDSLRRAGRHVAHTAAVDAPAVHRAIRVRQRRHARAGADAAALLVQQSARRVRAVQRIRRDARVRRVADRSVPEPHAARRRDRSVDQAALRQQAPRAGRVRQARGNLARHAVGAPLGRRARETAQHARSRLQGHSAVPRGSRGQEIQAVHQSFLAAVPDGARVSAVPRHEAQAGGAPGARRRRDDRRGVRAPRRPPARLARGADAQPVRAPESPRTSSRKRATASSSCATSD